MGRFRFRCCQSTIPCAWRSTAAASITREDGLEGGDSGSQDPRSHRKIQITADDYTDYQSLNQTLRNLAANIKSVLHLRTSSRTTQRVLHLWYFLPSHPRHDTYLPHRLRILESLGVDLLQPRHILDAGHPLASTTGRNDS